MIEAELFWTKWAAIGQLLGAGATFMAVAASLWIALYGLRPKLKLRAQEWTILGSGTADDEQVFAFQIANVGERPIQVRSFGKTGWLGFGPAWLRRQYAMQNFNSVLWTTAPPFDLQPGTEVSSHVYMHHLLAHCEARASGPSLYARDYPILGCRATRIKAVAHLAGGRIVECRVHPAAAKKLADAECRSPAPEAPV